jgi:Fe-S cluster assembly iron-binding protein IscA
MALDESQDTKENIFNIEKVKVIIDDKTIEMIDKGTPLSIDFMKTDYQEGFTINNGSNC